MAKGNPLAVVIKTFRDRFTPQDPTARKGLGLTKTEAEVFWVALANVSEQTLEVLELVQKATAASIKGAGFHTGNISRKKGLLKAGKTWGSYIITKRALRLMQGALDYKGDGSEEAQSPKPGKRGGKRGQKKVRNAPPETRKTGIRGPMRKLFTTVTARLDQLDSIIAEAQREREDILAEMTATIKKRTQRA